MSKGKEIIEGWANLLLQRQNEVSEKRMKVCNDCEHISTKHETIRPDVHCTICFCTLAAKTRSLESSCPIGLWEEENVNKDNNENGKEEV